MSPGPGSAAAEHYDQLLGSVYSWMLGDPEAALARGRAFLDRLAVRPGITGVAVDLGAGPGFQAVPLAERGFSVVAVDFCRTLLDELAARAAGLPVRAVEGDLLDFRAHAPAADVILCLGDTLPHLESPAAVDRLLSEATAALAPGGTLALTFRDYTALRTGDQRFILVRSDDRRILTCFLEDAGEVVRVHDLLHERTADGWTLRVSSYPKLRLAPDRLEERLRELGLDASRETLEGGMVLVVGRSTERPR